MSLADPDSKAWKGREGRMIPQFSLAWTSPLLQTHTSMCLVKFLPECVISMSNSIGIKPFYNLLSSHGVIHNSLIPLFHTLHVICQQILLAPP